MGHFEEYEKGQEACRCDTCEYIRRFGDFMESIRGKSIDPICALCEKKYFKHNGWQCPEKTEWTLPSGATIKYLCEHDGATCLNINSQKIVIETRDIPSLINILEEIGGRQ